MCVNDEDIRLLSTTLMVFDEVQCSSSPSRFISLCFTEWSFFLELSAAELLTTNKLSELACLALYLMYEKKQGKESYWYPYIRELDRQRGRGQLAVESPLLWSREELNEYFAGSPMKVLPTCACIDVSAVFILERKSILSHESSTRVSTVIAVVILWCNSRDSKYAWKF